MSAKKRTKSQKQQAEVRRQTNPAQLNLQTGHYEFKDISAADSKVVKKVATAEKILGYDLPVLYRDVAKTAVVTTIIISILVGLVVLTPYF